MPRPAPVLQTIRDTLNVLAAPVFVLVAHLLRVILLTEYIAFDMLMHYLGGAAIAVSGLVLVRILYRRGALPADIPSWFGTLTLFGVVGLAGVFWEFHEFLTDAAVRTVMQGGLADTMADLALDLLGGVTVLLAAPWFGQQAVKK